MHHCRRQWSQLASWLGSWNSRDSLSSWFRPQRKCLHTRCLRRLFQSALCSEVSTSARKATKTSNRHLCPVKTLDVCMVQEKLLHYKKCAGFFHNSSPQADICRMESRCAAPGNLKCRPSCWAGPWPRLDEFPCGGRMFLANIRNNLPYGCIAPIALPTSRNCMPLAFEKAEALQHVCWSVYSFRLRAFATLRLSGNGTLQKQFFTRSGSFWWTKFASPPSPLGQAAEVFPPWRTNRTAPCKSGNCIIPHRWTSPEKKVV